MLPESWWANLGVLHENIDFWFGHLTLFSKLNTYPVRIPSLFTVMRSTKSLKHSAVSIKHNPWICSVYHNNESCVNYSIIAYESMQSNEYRNTIYIDECFVVGFQFSHPRSIYVNKFINYAHNHYQLPLSIWPATGDTSYVVLLLIELCRHYRMGDLFLACLLL